MVNWRIHLFDYCKKYSFFPNKKILFYFLLMKNTFYFLLINKIFPGNVSNNIRIIITSRKKNVNSIHYRNTTGINTVLKSRSNKQHVPIVLHALIISLKLFEHRFWHRNVHGLLSYPIFSHRCVQYLLSERLRLSA